MGDSENQNGHSAARAMLDAFTSVGATRFDVTWTSAAGEEQAFRRNSMTAYLARILSAVLDDAAQKQRNVIVRPRGGTGVTFVQLDDLNEEKLARVAPAVFLTLETSPGNFQAWAALETVDKDFVRRFKKGTGADATASGATRIAGSLNFKEKYAPNFPRVAIREAHPGRLTTPAELEALGLVAPPEIVTTDPTPPSPARRLRSSFRRKWPSYQMSLDGAPLNSEGTGPDTSRADFVWCMTAISWGWRKDETAEKLMEESTKAKTNGKTYADLTAQNAALAVEHRRQQPKRHQIG